MGGNPTARPCLSTRLPRRLLAAVGVALLAAGCKSAPKGDAPGPLVLYTSADKALLKPLVDGFGKKTGVSVEVVLLPQNATGSALGPRLAAEGTAPRADVFWTVDPVEAQQIAAEGRAEAYKPLAEWPAPAGMKDPRGLWCGVGARARALVYSSKAVGGKPPAGYQEAVNPRWRGKVTLTAPTHGDALLQAAAMASPGGAGAVASYYRKVLANGGTLVDGESAAIVSVTGGFSSWTVADAVSSHAATVDRGAKLAYPDTRAGGVFLVPHAVGLVKGAARPKAARRLLDFVLSSEGGQILASAPGYLVSLDSRQPSSQLLPGVSVVKAAKVDYRQVYRDLGAVRRAIDGLLHPAPKGVRG